MSEQQQRMAAVETDKELSDLLDFSAVRQWGSRLGDFWVALGRSIADGVWTVCRGQGMEVCTGEGRPILYLLRDPTCSGYLRPLLLIDRFDDITPNKCRFTSGCLKFIPTFNGIRGYDSDLIERSLVCIVRCKKWIRKRSFHPCFSSASAFLLSYFQVF